MSISSEIRECKLCPLSSMLDLGFSPQPGIGKPTAEILVVYDRLSQTDYLSQNYMSGAEGILFDRILSKVELRREEMYITTILKCYSAKTPPGKCYTTCKQWLDKQIAVLKPKLIVAFGSQSIKRFTRKTTDAYVDVIKFGGALVVPMPALFHLLNLGNSMLQYHIERLKKARQSLN